MTTFYIVILYSAHVVISDIPIVLAKVSAIHDISLSPVPISGAGTSTPGPE